jgi:hypothetical protein
MKKYQGGYVGLLALLISLAIMTYLIVEVWLKPIATENGGTTTTYTQAILEAEKAKASLEHNQTNTSHEGVNQAQNAAKLLEQGQK